MQLSKRLQAVADLAERAACIADVGTDHGYIPIYMVKNGLADHALAMDINEGPLLRAQHNIRAYDLEDRIVTRLSDGLAELRRGEADTVVIAGMGGQLTVHILTCGEHALAEAEKLVLQPQSEIFLVRQYLADHGFRIVKETIVFEDGKYYPMMQARHREEGGEAEAYSPAELEFGKHLIPECLPVWKDFLNREKASCEKILESLRSGQGERIEERRNEISDRLAYIEESLGRSK